MIYIIIYDSDNKHAKATVITNSLINIWTTLLTSAISVNIIKKLFSTVQN